MKTTSSVASIGLPELQNVLGSHCLPHLSAAQLATLRATSRSLRELVDGPCHEAWAQVAPALLPVAAIPAAWTSGAGWQDAIRGEWTSQQAVRSASLGRVINISSETSFWVVEPKAGPFCSYLLLKYGYEGKLQVLDVDKPDAQPVRLDFTASGAFFAFVSSDSQLRVVEAVDVHGGRPKLLLWRAVDPCTGQTLSSKYMCEWPSSPYNSSQPLLAQVYHPAMHRVVGLAPRANLIYIMHADTLQITAECHVPTGHAERVGASLDQPDSLGWSSDGHQLAVSIFHYSSAAALQADADSTGEVHVFDTASGHCLQSLAFHGTAMQISWSSSLPLLLVCSQKARSYIYSLGPDTNEDPEGGDPLSFCPIRVLCPPEKSVVKAPAALADDSYWHSCRWTPCGRLVVADYRDSSFCKDDPTWICIMEPGSLKQIFKAKDWPDALSWASRGQAVYAHFPAQGICVKFFTRDGTWQAVTCITDTWLQGCYMGTFSPSASMLVLPAAEPNEPDLLHYDLEERCCYSIAKSPCYAGFDNIQVAWLPHPSGWAPVYMFVHQPGVQEYLPLNQQVVLPSMKLVDAKAHIVLGNWTAEVLKEWAGLGRDYSNASDASRVPPLLIWSPNGKHLAAQDPKHAFVMSFGPAP